MDARTTWTIGFFLHFLDFYGLGKGCESDLGKYNEGLGGSMLRLGGVTGIANRFW
jgi:hypothetical protein